MAIKDDMEDVQEAVINELITENGITNTLADGQVTPAKLSQAYLPLTGGSVTGKVGIGTDNPDSFNSSANQLVISGSSNTGLTIAATATTSSSIFFSDGPNGAEEYRGYIQYQHGGSFADSLVIGTAASDSIRIKSNGNVILHSVPTSATGLTSGTLYRTGNSLKIVP